MTEKPTADDETIPAQINEQHRVSESADKITAKANVKRGEGTRDQDKITVKVKGDDPVEVVSKLNETLSRLHNTAEDMRAMQPDGEATSNERLRNLVIEWQETEAELDPHSMMADLRHVIEGDGDE